MNIGLVRYADVEKETADLEAQAYELEQRTALAAEAKSVLDSWVRYEGQVKQRQQRELAETVIGKIHKELENPKAVQQILQQSVADVERKLSYNLDICGYHQTLTGNRHHDSQVPVNGSRVAHVGIMYKKSFTCVLQ